MREKSEIDAIRASAVVEDRPDPGWYALYVEDHQLAGVLKYLSDDRGGISLLHTEIYPQWEGLGLASILVREALDDIGKRGLAVDPQCSYVVGFIGKHPEYEDLVRPSA